MPTFKPIRKGVRYSEAIAEAYASSPSNVIVYHTLEFLHSGFVDDDGATSAARVVCGLTNIYAILEAGAPLNGGESVLFVGLPFEITLPSEEDEGTSGELRLRIENVSKYLIPYLDIAVQSSEPIKVVYRPYLSTDLTAPHIDPPLTMTLRNVTCDVYAVNATCGFGDMTNRKFPYVSYTTKNFPGLTAR